MSILKSSRLADKSLSLELTDDERLVTTEAKSVGRLGAIIKNIVGFLVSIVGIRGGTLLTGTEFLEATAAPKKDPQEQYEKDHPEMGLRRRKLRDAMDVLGAKLIEVEKSISQTPDKPARDPLRAYATDIKDGLKNLRPEAEIIEAHFAAWKARKEAPKERLYEFTYRIAQLPDTATFNEGQPVPPLGDVEEAYKAFGLIVSKKDNLPVPDADPPPAPAPGAASMPVCISGDHGRSSCRCGPSRTASSFAPGAARTTSWTASRPSASWSSERPCGRRATRAWPSTRAER